MEVWFTPLLLIPKSHNLNSACLLLSSHHLCSHCSKLPQRELKQWPFTCEVNMLTTWLKVWTASKVVNDSHHELSQLVLLIEIKTKCLVKSETPFYYNSDPPPPPPNVNGHCLLLEGDSDCRKWHLKINFTYQVIQCSSVHVHVRVFELRSMRVRCSRALPDITSRPIQSTILYRLLQDE